MLLYNISCSFLGAQLLLLNLLTIFSSLTFIPTLTPFSVSFLTLFPLFHLQYTSYLHPSLTSLSFLFSFIRTFLPSPYYTLFISFSYIVLPSSPFSISTSPSFHFTPTNCVIHRSVRVPRSVCVPTWLDTGFDLIRQSSGSKFK